MVTVQPFFSIIIPTFNRPQNLRIAISSVLNQIVTDWELIVVDDGSSKETKELLKKFHDNRIKYCRQEHNERSAARNLGISHSTGQYVCFLDDDDYFERDHLSTFKHHISSQLPKKILRLGYYTKQDGDREKSPLYVPEKHKHPVRFFAEHMCGIWSLCIPRLYLQDHSFPVAFPHWQDTHLALRLLALYPFEQLEGWTYVYCQHKGMGSQSLFKGSQIMVRTHLQLDAIKHLFANYSDLIGPYLSDSTKQKLIAEKCIRASALLREQGFLRHSFSMLTMPSIPASLWPSTLKQSAKLTKTIIQKAPTILAKTLVNTISLQRAKGSGVECLCCGSTFKTFKSFGVFKRPNAQCWTCGSLERHRLLWLYFERELALFTSTSPLKILHLGPSRVLYNQFNKQDNIVYIAGDVAPEDYDFPVKKIDITHVENISDAVDLLIAIHVLEHVENDSLAIKTMYDLLGVGGKALIMVPLDADRLQTKEMGFALSDTMRIKHFGQSDHVRVYGLDFRDRLMNQGFQVEELRYAHTLNKEEQIKYSVFENDIIFVCHKRTEP